MAAEVAVGYISIVPEVKGFAGQLRRETTKAGADSGKETGSKFSGAMKAAAAGFVGLGVVHELRNWVAAAEDAAVSQAKLAGVMDSMGFGQFTSHVQAYANALGRKIAVDNDDIAKTQAKIATFKELAATAGDSEGYFNRVTKAAYDMEALGFAPAEQGAIMLSKALNSPEQAAALSRTGALTKAEAEHAKALADSGRAEEARAFIMAAVEKQVQGSAEKNVTASAKMAVAWGQLSETLGTALLPVVNVLADALGAVTDWMAQNPELVGVLVPIILALAAALAIAAIAQWAMNLALLANPITWIILAVVALVAAIVWLWNNMDTVKAWLAAAWEWIKTTVGAIFGAIVGYWRTMWEGFLSIGVAAWNAITGFLTGAWDAIKGAFLAVWNAVLAYWSFLWNAVKTVATAIWDAIRNVATTTWDSIKNAVTGAINTVKNVITSALNIVKGIWNSTFGAMKNVITTVFTTVKNIVDKIAGAIQGAIDKIKAAISSVGSAIAGVPVLGSVMKLVGFADGGLIGGAGNRDSQVIAATPGEFMLNRQQVAQVGASSLESWRQGGPPPGGGGGITVQNLNVNNPAAEPASDSLPRALRQLAYVGVA